MVTHSKTSRVILQTSLLFDCEELENVWNYIFDPQNSRQNVKSVLFYLVFVLELRMTLNVLSFDSDNTDTTSKYKIFIPLRIISGFFLPNILDSQEYMMTKQLIAFEWFNTTKVCTLFRNSCQKQFIFKFSSWEIINWKEGKLSANSYPYTELHLYHSESSKLGVDIFQYLEIFLYDHIVHLYF